ncbi:MAG: hypothetical protein ACOVNR_03165 [Chitinophagaceae bacterium]
MKYSQQIGILSALIVVTACFLPWVSIESLQAIINGFETSKTNFGRPGIMQTSLSVIMLLMFAINRIWAKRTNIFLGAFNFAWSVRNYIIVSTCAMGECPQKKLGLYMLVTAAFVCMVMIFLPQRVGKKS